MVVRILKSSPDFKGVHYNEDKNSKNQSALLKSKNFEGMLCEGEPKRMDFIRYMTLVGALNERVKNKQFHAAVSTKGKLHSHEELAEIGRRYLEMMGYGDNPYLIYVHYDTNNNHVHLVSTRVDKNGDKIDDRFENIRSQRIMATIMQQDHSRDTSDDVKKALNYRFSTVPQFMCIMEDMGYSGKEVEGKILLFKYGTQQYSMDKAKLHAIIEKYEPDSGRIKQLKAIFLKYRGQMNLEEFQENMHRKFGVKLFFHQHPEREKPYGYTLLDHSNQQVLKGAQVMKLDKLLVDVDRQQQIESAKENVLAMDFQSYSFRGLKRELKKQGLYLDQEGKVYLNNKKEMGFMLPHHVLKELKYRGRLEAAALYKVRDQKEHIALAKLFHVRTQDFRPKNGDMAMKGHYEEIIAAINEGRDPNETLQGNRFRIVHLDDHQFLIDDNEKELVDISDSTRSMSNLEPMEYRFNESMAERLVTAQHHTLLTVLLDTISVVEYHQGKDKKRTNQQST